MANSDQLPPYQRALALTTTGFMLIAHEDPALLSAVLRSWEVRWKARVVAMGFATLTLTVGNPPRDETAALAVAAEHFALCPDNIWQGSLDTMTAYAAHLRDNRTWEFWWD